MNLISYDQAVEWMKSGKICILNGLMYSWKENELRWFDGFRWHTSNLHSTYRSHVGWMKS